MALTKETTASIVTKYGAKENDTGNVKVQIALLTERTKQLTAHSKAFPKDSGAKRALLKVVGQRRKMLRYFERTDLEGYRAFIKELGLRKQFLFFRKGLLLYFVVAQAFLVVELYMREASRFDFFQVADEHKCMQKSTGRCGVSPLEGVAENALQLRRGEGVPPPKF